MRFLCWYIRYSEKVLNRRSQNETKVEYTTEQIRMELAGNEALYKTSSISSIGRKKLSENIDKQRTDDVDEPPASVSNEPRPAEAICNADASVGVGRQADINDDANANADEQPDTTKEPSEIKSKKKRRKRSMMKKKSSIGGAIVPAQSVPSTTTSITNTPRNNSSSSSLGSMSTVPSEHNDIDIGSNVRILTSYSCNARLSEGFYKKYFCCSLFNWSNLCRWAPT